MKNNFTKEYIKAEITKIIDSSMPSMTNIPIELDVDELSFPLNKRYDAYKIPIQYLFLNPTNTRFESFIKLSSISNDIYSADIQNNIQAIILQKSEPDNKKTLASLKKMGLHDPLVITDEGRVLSGNRRLSIIKRIFQIEPNDIEAEHLKYLDCIVLKNIDSEEKIKELEIRLQNDVDVKVDYDEYEKIIQIKNAYDSGKPFSEISKIWKISDMTTRKYKVIGDYISDFLYWLDREGDYKFAWNKDLYSIFHAMTSMIPSLKNDFDYDDLEINEFKKKIFRFLISTKGIVRLLRDTVNLSIKEKNINKVLEKFDLHFEKNKDYINSVYNEYSKTTAVDGEIINPSLIDQQKNFTKVSEAFLTKIKSDIQNQVIENDFKTLMENINDSVSFLKKEMKNDKHKFFLSISENKKDSLNYLKKIEKQLQALIEEVENITKN